MTPSSDRSPIEAAEDLFIRRWGEMAASWGVSRTMAEIHALLYLARQPLCTDDVMERLAVSRGSASMNLRELVNWGLVVRIHRRGDRKEYFEAEKDVWQMFDTIVRERRRREVQPIVETTRRCLEMVEEARRSSRGTERSAAEEAARRYAAILEFCDIMNTLFSLVDRAGRNGLRPLVQAIGRLSGQHDRKKSRGRTSAGR
ncbi:MAG: ArsR family transcriptional regulator [Planctomycetota bacterium]|nr:MAG: ArsR family transcriptional regulator [Planctomycetota bacterium]